MPKPKYKLCILANAFISTKSIGGGDRFIIQITPYTSQKAITTVITSHIGLQHWEKQPPSKTEFLSYSPNPFDNSDNYFAISLTYFIRFLQTSYFLRNNNFTHLLTSSQYFPDILPAVLYKLINPKTRWVSRIYHLVPPPYKRVGNPLVNTIVYLMQYIITWLLKLSDQIITDNKQTKQQLIKEGFEAKKVSILANGIDYKIIKSHKSDKKYSFEAAYIGRLDLHRGILDLPEIWGKVVQKIPTAKLAVVGYGPRSTTDLLKKYFRVHNIEKNTKFLGFLPHNSNGKHPLYGLLKDIKISVLPLHEGGLPLTIAEAMAAGVPVIAYHLPVLNSVYKKGIITVKMNNKQEFAHNCIKLLTDKKLLKKLSLDSQRLARQFDNQKIASKLNQIMFKN
jgi:glycosyltransferase involved in cell wall biosynthesis